MWVIHYHIDVFNYVCLENSKRFHIVKSKYMSLNLFHIKINLFLYFLYLYSVNILEKMIYLNLLKK